MTSPASRRSTRTGAAAAFLALLLSGCAVGPDATSTDIALPAHWQRGGDGRSVTPEALGEWWRDFRDPQLDSLVARAVEGNLDVASAKAKIREARALRREAVGGLLPSLDASATALRRQTAGKPTVVSDLFQGGLDASWEIDLFGANARGVEAATANTAATRDDLDAVLLTLVGDVTATYVEVRGTQARIGLAERTARSQRQTAALTRSKFEAGSASAVDTAKAEATAATTEAGIPSLQTTLAQSVHRLSILTGQAPGALAGELRRDGAIPSPRRALPKGIPADVLHNRPDVRAAERRLAAYTAKLGVAEAALYPSISLTGAISTSATRLGDLGRASTIAWSWGPSITLPIFRGGTLVAARDAAAAVRDEFLLAWRSAVLTSLEDVENALVALADERVRARRLGSATDNSRRAATLSRALYQSGSASFLDVLDAERSLYTAEDALLLSRMTIATDHIALAKALGGGWRRPVDTVTPAVVDVDTGPHLAAPVVAPTEL
ncbi:efflux transporter outer membrane subunit [Siculibacillus lacustris]|uniref:Efflux transporter outer membrane subunit n=1 Tax=Siculibacillus lacustris TaxID=1549641 RepID=A0A4Q9VVJ3_9HYPH|nr:efflux transporter outer membrane subunit [Siculibacillus lacustris]TBW40282.1 efflux transporter outer membrane subunit [Siculibacillus lacustris]